jgi:hypothetical protein
VIVQRPQRAIFDQHQAPGMLDQRLPRGRQMDAPRGTHQKLSPKLTFKRLDSLRDGRLREAHAVGRTAVVAEIGDRDESSQLTQLQRCQS